VTDAVRLLSGERRGLWAAAQRGILYGASWGYGLAVRLRNVAYDRGWRSIQRAGVPVISIGNLTTGGTGKTPTVEYVCRLLREQDRRVAILSRGYGVDHGPNDEALLLEDNLPDVPHLQGKDRVALAQLAVEELQAECLVLDDGMQHRRLHRDLEIVLIDATNPWGYGHLLPRGLLREPTSGLRRAQAVVLTRCDQIGKDQLRTLTQEVENKAPQAVLVTARHAPLEFVNSEGREEPTWVHGRSAVAFAGIGNPGSFVKTLAGLGANVVATRWFPDHHRYTADDVVNLNSWAAAFPDGTLVLTTQKDYVKLRLARIGPHPMWALRVGLLPLGTGETLLRGLIARVPF
jgi:tetraacyldisaccharide 4'-kinase